METSVFSGSCLCGKVKYTVATHIDAFYFCHCEQCRKITGSAFASNILTKSAEVNWISGFEWLKRFDYPGERIFTKVFCTHCGSGMPYLNKQANALVIPADSLDHAPNIKPNHNIFWADKASWYESGIAAPKCAGFSE
ncbi:aldehyde-activating protein [Methyloprofundus sedimenti]|uniref:Aldehyde-activating protein n=1 Tax=Methyloprofundus sedimenti TaxID=1420851 RepID=A0A1V8MB71_9GAMM|nr:GFA family protein [Methyloprofundus sedimenti]OQK18573.1 aldehyde-activating protein [Methyloprofundus sedimenti]